MLGDATAIRASNPRSQKTDKRDARHILRLLEAERFPRGKQVYGALDIAPATTGDCAHF